MANNWRRKEVSWHGCAYPVLHADTVYHQGALVSRPGRAGRYSLEGPTISVSVDPAAWRRIARLDGNLFEIRLNGNPVLDMLALNEPEYANTRAKIRAFALEEGLATEGVVFRCDGYFEDEPVFSLHETYDDALMEADDDPDAVSEVPQLVGTEALAQACNVAKVDLSLVNDFATIVFAEKVLGLAGVWWSEEFDPVALSAPRGGIFHSERERGRLTFRTINQELVADQSAPEPEW